MDSSVPRPSGNPSTSIVSDSARGRLSCSECGHEFNRIDHLNRHRRSHDPQNVCLCPICERSFTRGDSLTRHIRSHREAISQNLPHPRRISSRVPKACKYCAKSKLRCNGFRPCARCSAKDMECVDAGGQRTRDGKRDCRPNRVAEETSLQHLTTFESCELSIGNQTSSMTVDQNSTDVEVCMARLLSQAQGPSQLATPSPSNDQGIEDSSPRQSGNPDELSSASLSDIRLTVNTFGPSKQRGSNSCESTSSPIPT
ncbi:hypothetical protein N431DRAFT_529030, partial [Stipitochalara longipes BDJ]